MFSQTTHDSPTKITDQKLSSSNLKAESSFEILKNLLLSLSQAERVQVLSSLITQNRKDREDKEKKEPSFEKAISLARTDIPGNKGFGQVVSPVKYIMHWLNQAIQYHKNGLDELEKEIKPDEFKKYFAEMTGTDLFHEDTLPLLPFMKKRVVKLYFGLDYRFCNKHLTAFIADNDTLNLLDLSAPSLMSDEYKLAPSQIPYLVNGLKTNRGLESLNLSNQAIDEDSLIMIFDALANNPKSKLKQLNLTGHIFSTKAAAALVDLLEKNRFLDVRFTYCSDLIYLEKLESLLAHNKNCNAKLAEQQIHLSSISLKD